MGRARNRETGRREEEEGRRGRETEENRTLGRICYPRSLPNTKFTVSLQPQPRVPALLPCLALSIAHAKGTLGTTGSPPSVNTLEF